MSGQDQHWSEAAQSYEQDFIDPYHAHMIEPLLTRLRGLVEKGAQTVADLGCGIGPLLPFLSEHFPTVHAVDFAPGMLARAREQCQHLKNVTFLRQPFTELSPLHGQLEVAVAVNSLILPNVTDLDRSLTEIRTCLKPRGTFLAVLPAMDAVHYCTMLLLDRSLASGKPLDAARKNAAHHGEHHLYDFAFGQFRFRGLEQHFWQPFEVAYRFKKAGFCRIRRARLLLSWDQHACGKEFSHLPPPWDFLVQAEAPR